MRNLGCLRESNESFKKKYMYNIIFLNDSKNNSYYLVTRI